MSKTIEDTIDSIRAMFGKLVAENRKLTRELRDCQNELCLKCGEYKERHNGACNGCRWLPEEVKVVIESDPFDEYLESLRREQDGSR